MGETYSNMFNPAPTVFPIELESDDRLQVLLVLRMIHDGEETYVADC
jgi:hypothetical protein